MNKLNKTDTLFVVALISVFFIHVIYLFLVPFAYDESFYITMPFRLINGDSMIQHDWHLTQFSSLFTYLPVFLWTAIKGSTDYIFIFLRCVYLVIHTAIAALIYRFFKQYGKWAVLASIIFYIQVPYSMMALSYQSVFVICLLLLSLCLLTIYKKQSMIVYIFAGICFGCCCVCFSVQFLCCILLPVLYGHKDEI